MMTENSSQADGASWLSDCLFETTLGLLLPFFLAGAGDDPVIARMAIVELINAYEPASLQELDLVSRIIAFSTVAMDNLRLSMVDPAMPDTKILRYRNNAVALSRSAEQCRVALKAMRTKRLALSLQDALPTVPAQTVAFQAPPATVLEPAPNSAEAATPAPPRPDSVTPDLELMKQEARDAIAALRPQRGSLSAAAFEPTVPPAFQPVVPFGVAVPDAAHAALAIAGTEWSRAAATGSRY